MSRRNPKGSSDPRAPRYPRKCPGCKFVASGPTPLSNHYKERGRAKCRAAREERAAKGRDVWRKSDKGRAIHAASDKKHKENKKIKDRERAARNRARKKAEKAGMTLHDIPVKASRAGVGGRRRSALRYCTDCGGQKAPKWTYCGYCGHSL